MDAEEGDVLVTLHWNGYRNRFSNVFLEVKKNQQRNKKQMNKKKKKFSEKEIHSEFLVLE